MERKVEVGMYIRTKKGISKVVAIEPKGTLSDEQEVYYVNHNLYPDITRTVYEKDVVGEPSFNIIDVIEEGDIVNGTAVGYIDDCSGAMREFYWCDEDPSTDVGHWDEEIRSVLTKELYRSMRYDIIVEKLRNR